MDQEHVGSGAYLAGSLVCPFCRAGLLPDFGETPVLDTTLQCLRCLAAVLVTAVPDAPEHAERMAALLREFDPDGDTDLRLKIRRVADAGRTADGQPLVLLAAWNMAELVGPLLAARVLDLPRDEVARLLSAGAFPGAVQSPPPRGRFERPRWLIPRTALLEHLDSHRL